MPEATVAAVILNEKNEILLTRRTHNPFEGFFCLPGGHIDAFEEADVAVVREVKEETDLDFVDVEFFHLNEEIYPDKKIHNIALCYVGEGKGTLKINEESSESIWVDMQKASEMELAFGHEKVIEFFIEQYEN
jgi:mutator protein MutT